MRRICVVSRNEIISGDVELGNIIRNSIEEPFRTYGYSPEEFKKKSLGKKFQSFLMKGDILRYDRYSGNLRTAKNKSLNIPFGTIVFLYGIGKDEYRPDVSKQLQSKYDKGSEGNIFRFKLNCSLGRFELEGDSELGLANYIINPKTGRKEITSFKEGFLTLKNPRILSANTKLKYINEKTSICSKYFEISGIRFDIYEAKNLEENLAKKEPSRISDSYFGLNPITPMIISTSEPLLGPYIYQEL